MTATLSGTAYRQHYREAFVAIPNGWGRQGWTTATLSKLSVTELRAALEMAYAHGAAKKPVKRKRSR